MSMESSVEIFLNVSPVKGVMILDKKGKLIPRYVGTYKILKWVGNVFDELLFPIELAIGHLVFHISLLKNVCG